MTLNLLDTEKSVATTMFESASKIKRLQQIASVSVNQHKY